MPTHMHTQMHTRMYCIRTQNCSSVAHTKCLHKCLHEMPTRNLPTQMHTRNAYTNVLYLNYFPSATAHTKCPHKMHTPKDHFSALGPPNCPSEQNYFIWRFRDPKTPNNIVFAPAGNSGAQWRSERLRSAGSQLSSVRELRAFRKGEL